MIRYIKLVIICLFTLSGMNSFGQTYCSPSYPSGCPFSNYITNVNIGTINHSPPGCAVSNYTSISTLIPAGVATPITVTTSSSSPLTLLINNASNSALVLNWNATK